MHIPDGYLSPSICAAAYATAAPFWYAALNRVQRLLRTRLVPVLATVSAFCFVVMMFNLPIPGGTTAHAVGIGVAVVVLGPSAAIVAISIALMMQALFFGDGGITTYGANCFNMAIVGSLVAYASYRLIAGRTPIESARRVGAAAIAGYVGINASALLTAFELGIQPMLFHDAGGAPLYAPYPLSVAVPAIMLTHLTVAGAAEAVISAGVVAYLQRANPSLLQSTAKTIHGTERTWVDISRYDVRRLWVGVGALMVLSPLGLMATGFAWGEWRAHDLANPALRGQIAHVSGNMAPPAHVPLGLDHLASIWRAPMPNYAPAFMHNEYLAYFVSAIVGTGLILLVFSGLLWLFGRCALVGADGAAIAEQSIGRHGRHRGNFLDNLADGIAQFLDHALDADNLSRCDGFLQKLDPRVKLGAIFGLIVVSVFVESLTVLAGLFLLAVGLAAVSHVTIPRLTRQVWIGVLAFTGLIALPAVFLVPGDVLFHLPVLTQPLTVQGLRSAAFLLGRTGTAATYALLLVLSTSWPHLLKAMRTFRVPSVLVVVFGLTHRYVFVFLQITTQMFEARRSRLIGPLAPRARRRLATATAGVLLSKALDMSTEVHLAMVSRGYRGDPRLLDEFCVRPIDWTAAAGFAAIATLALWFST